jgi:hypothetical protein
MDDLGTWEALLGVPDGIEHAFATVKDCAPEAAVEAAMARAAEKYGPQDLTRWNFRAELCAIPVVLRTVRLEWRDGALHRRPET